MEHTELYKRMTSLAFKQEVSAERTERIGRIIASEQLESAAMAPIERGGSGRRRLQRIAYWAEWRRRYGWAEATDPRLAYYFQDEIVAHDVDGRVIHRRPPTPFELAVREHGLPERTPEWCYHPVCHKPPERFGACVMRFEDGCYWCFGCRVAWRP